MCRSLSKNSFNRGAERVDDKGLVLSYRDAVVNDGGFALGQLLDVGYRPVGVIDLLVDIIALKAVIVLFGVVIEGIGVFGKKLDRQTDNAGGSLPGCSARRTTDDLNRFDAIGGYQNRKLRCAEYAAV